MITHYLVFWLKLRHRYAPNDLRNVAFVQILQNNPQTRDNVNDSDITQCVVHSMLQPYNNLPTRQVLPLFYMANYKHQKQQSASLMLQYEINVGKYF